MKEDPWTVTFKFWIDTISKIPPHSMLAAVESELKGYQDCVEKGRNPDKLPPPHLKAGEEFYLWRYWKECSMVLMKCYDPSLFKEEAMKKYISIAQNYHEKVYKY